jgi:nicotinic acid mononucleotide adenylyltransferase
MTPTLASSSRLSPFKSPNGPAGAGNPAVPPPKVGSFDVLTAVREANPFASFSWCLGADTFADLRRGKWVNGAEFTALCTQLYVVPRVGGSDAAWVEIQEAATEDEEEIKALLGAGSSDDDETQTPSSLENDDSLLIRVENASVMEIPGMSQDVSSTAVRDALRRRGLSERAGAFREDSDRQLSAGTDLLLDEATLATAVSEEVLQYATRHGLYA